MTHISGQFLSFFLVSEWRNCALPSAPPLFLPLPLPLPHVRTPPAHETRPTGRMSSVGRAKHRCFLRRGERPDCAVLEEGGKKGKTERRRLGRAHKDVLRFCFFSGRKREIPGPLFVSSLPSPSGRSLKEISAPRSHQSSPARQTRPVVVVSSRPIPLMRGRGPPITFEEFLCILNSLYNTDVQRIYRFLERRY